MAKTKISRWIYTIVGNIVLCAATISVLQVSVLHIMQPNSVSYQKIIATMAACMINLCIEECY